MVKLGTIGKMVHDEDEDVDGDDGDDGDDDDVG